MRLSTGVEGLDTVIEGGLPAGRNYVVRGGPGTGKTTLALQFLTEGTARGESALYVSLTSPEADVRADASTVDLDIEKIAILDLSTPTGIPPDADEHLERRLFREDQQLNPIVRAIMGQARALEPRRVVIDSLTRLRELIRDIHEFRREVLALVRALTEVDATLVSTSEDTERLPDDELQFLADGVISLEARPKSRTLQVTKLRGSGFRDAPHTVRLTDQGMVVFPRLVPDDHRGLSPGEHPTYERLSFGVPEINELLHGGLERGTITLISGPSGVGKTTIGAQFMKEAAGRGERSVLFMFDEAPDTFVHRCESVAIPVREMIDRGTLSLTAIEPLTHTPDEIAAMVRTEVEERGATVVMIDSVASYQLSVPTRESESWMQLHALGRYLKNRGVTGVLIDEVPIVTGDFIVSEQGLSYLADSVIFLRHLEVQAELSKVIGVLKKRTSGYEQALRELEITEHGLKVGAPLVHLRGVLSGIPELIAVPGSDGERRPRVESDHR